MFDSVMNISAYLGNTTDNFFKISNLKLGHNYTFTVQARCLFGSQICGEPAVLLYDELGSGKSLLLPFSGKYIKDVAWFDEHVHACSVASVISALCKPVDYSLPGSSVHGILQAKILEWVSMSSSRGSS